MKSIVRSSVKLAALAVAGFALFGTGAREAEARPSMSSMTTYYDANHNWLGSGGMSCYGLVEFHGTGAKYAITTQSSCNVATVTSSTCYSLNTTISDTGQEKTAWTEVDCSEVDF